MATFRDALPQLRSAPFLTDSGLETTLVFHDGIELPCFAAYPLVLEEVGRARLRAYYLRHGEIAAAAGAGFILESPTWRASADWGARLGHDTAVLADANARAIALMADVRETLRDRVRPLVISGQLGPRRDGYQADLAMTVEEAEAYHAPQVASFAASEADLVTALTMTNTAEAIGIARAAGVSGIPAVISFTVETDGRLPTGQALGEAIQAVDDATNGGVAYFMVNCAHPSHLADALEPGAHWARRLRGIRANASRRSHAELDEATDLDAGDPEGLGMDYAALRRLLPQLTVLGGCCGTDHRHLEAIARVCLLSPSDPEPPTR